MCVYNNINKVAVCLDLTSTKGARVLISGKTNTDRVKLCGPSLQVEVRNHVFPDIDHAKNHTKPKSGF